MRSSAQTFVKAEAGLAKDGPTHLCSDLFSHRQNDRNPFADPVRTGYTATFAREVCDVYLVTSTPHHEVRLN
jgi:hypothetical protein